MTALHFIHLPDQFREKTEYLLTRRGFVLSSDGMPVAVCEGDHLCVSLRDGTAEIIYPGCHFFRALGLLLDHICEDIFEITEFPKFANLGVQLDLSRNGALRVDSIKRYMDYLALMGYNKLYLYMEDMYDMPGRDYFGYMRGRYSAAELMELDDYAYGYGIELIPSIQTLGHHEQYLRWEESADIRDTANELLADSEQTYEFIEAMIRAVTTPLRTRKIVLGLDETHTLGLGEHLRRFGYEKKWDIFCRHLNRVFSITNALGLESMIYGDMFFRIAAPDGWYYTESTVIPPNIAQSIPENATVIYWHYGDEPGCDEYMLEKHMKLNRKTIFFGGTWTWSGHLPNTDFAISSTRDALIACEKYGITDVTQTLWSDDGCECNHLYGLLTLQYTAEYAFGHGAQEKWIENRFHSCTGADAQAFIDMNAYQFTLNQEAVSENFIDRFQGKTLFWQDVLLGQADAWLQGNPRSEHYEAYAARFAGYAQQNDLWAEHYVYIEKVFRYLSLKCRISERLRSAYMEHNRQAVERICYVELPELLTLIQQCHARHKALWMETYKSFGWEVLDIRYGGTAARIRTAQERLGFWLDGSISTLEELEEKRLPMRITPWNTYKRIVSASVCF